MGSQTWFSRNTIDYGENTYIEFERVPATDGVLCPSSSPRSSSPAPPAG